jgi:beta-xylosidase
MAQRDKSQGFGFIYVDIAKFLKEKANLVEEGFSVTPNPSEPAINFPKEEVPKSQSTEIKETAAKKIRENLDRLQSLHHKLHAMLAELNQSTNKDKKGK